MGGQSVAGASREDTAEFRHELLGRLGLETNASDQDIEGAHNTLVEFLERAPQEVRSWANARNADVGEAFALLSGPEEDLMSAAPVAPAVQVNLEKPFGSDVAPAEHPVPASGKPRRSQLVWAILPLLVVAVVVGVYFLGKKDAVPGMSGTPTNAQATQAPQGQAPVPVDQAKVAALTQKVTSNPRDVASLQGLGDAYFAASDYKNAAVWVQKVLNVDPKNQVGLLALGAAQFNLGNAAEAKKHWLVAAKLYPKSAEVHYDLGFLYLSETPPNKAKMTEEWNKVIAIDPNSAIAKTVATHLKPSPTPSGHPTAK